MFYTIQQLCNLAGISSRTLRYYDEIDLLKPHHLTPSGYRVYGLEEVDRLQIILFYKELGFRLETIVRLLNDPAFDRAVALLEHKKLLKDKHNQLAVLIQNVEQTIQSMKGGKPMYDEEKFEGFKRQIIDSNEEKYGKESRARYGDDAVDDSNTLIMTRSQNDHLELKELEEALIETLNEAFKIGDPESKLAQKAAHLHKEWLAFYWPKYTKEAHVGLAQIYVEDPRFKAYYDQHQEGTAEFLKQAIERFIKN